MLMHASTVGLRYRALAPLLAAVLSMVQYPSPAAATHGGPEIGSFLSCNDPDRDPPRCTSVGNDNQHFVYFGESLSEELASALRDALFEDYRPTDFIVFERHRITSVTDVIVESQDYGDNGAAGWVNCPPEAPQGFNQLGHRWCQRQDLRFNLNPLYAVFFADEVSREYVACHELGHTVGLRHWGNPPQSSGPVGATCMNVNTPDGPTHLHPADVEHINAYPY
ncbi:MAG: hypothetical protein LC753_08965 [Acidobacteria bacterium]|nr:hypothetical protein [Acidobacteriota bacterium]